MTRLEINVHADRIIRDYLEDGIEFSYVYEDPDLEDVSEDDLRAIHDAVNSGLRLLALTVRQW